MFSNIEIGGKLTEVTPNKKQYIPSMISSGKMFESCVKMTYVPPSVPLISRLGPNVTHIYAKVLYCLDLKKKKTIIKGNTTKKKTRQKFIACTITKYLLCYN